MDRWLPPRAPGGQPPPRFDAAPAPEPASPPLPDEPSPGGRAEPDARPAPAGWQPPTARPAPPGAAAPGSPAGRDERAATAATGATPTRRAASPVDVPTSPGMYGRRLGPSPPPRPVRRVRTQTMPSAAAGPNPAAVWALVFGIVGVVLILLSLGTLFVITLPCSTTAWVLARRARREIERGATTRGAGQAQVALWLGRIGVVVGLGALITFVVLSLAGFDFDQFRENLQRDLERRR